MKTILFILFFSLKIYSSDYPASYRYQVLTTDKTSSTVTKESFSYIPALILSVHTEEILKANKSVDIKTDWEKPFFTAWASVEGHEKYAINFWGGLARIPGMNDEGHALIACHELGHIIGGTPRIKIKEFLWSSAEGQSDYFATGICLKKYFTLRHNLQKLSIPDQIPETSFTLCRTNYQDEKDFLICLHTSKAIVAFTNLMNHLNWYEENYDLETPSKSIAKTTIFDSYPDAQCRIDTLFQGSLCPLKSFPCDRLAFGARPACWYR